MTPNEVASFVDFAITMAGSIVATLFGFRIVGKGAHMDAWYAKWGKHLRWLGPIIALFAVVQLLNP